MTEILQAISLILAAAVLGWNACLSFVIAPDAFRKMEYSHADGLVRRVFRLSHGPLAVISAVSGGFALLSGAWGAAIVLAMSAILYLMARWALAPRTAEENRVPVGAKRRVKTQRIASVGLTAFIMPIVCVGIVLTGLSV